MSGRGRGSAVVSDGRKSAFATRHILAGLIVLVCMACIPSVASADVDSVGGLEKVSTIKSSPHELTPLAGGAGLYQCSSAYAEADIHSEAWGLVIGNCKPGWKFEVLQHTGYNSAHKDSSYGGYVEGAFDACGWIESDEGPEQINEKLPNHCPGLSQEGSSVGAFAERVNGPSGYEDGYHVVNTVPCKEYANYRPWSKEPVEKEELRTVPAYAADPKEPTLPALLWRYVTLYPSTDSTGKYVMVRDSRYNGGEGNWVFVPRSCLPATLPEPGEALPEKPTVVTAGATYATPNATLSATVNPHGVETKYFFEYGITEKYGKVSEPTGNAGSGTSAVAVYAPITELAPGTTYYYRIVASSAIGESFGGPVAFTTQPPPTVTTTAASGVQEEQATLNGTVNGNGLNTTYHFEYGETTSYGSSTSAVGVGSGSSSPSVPVTGLKPGTTYHYQIVATSTAGTSVGTDQTFKTRERTNVFFTDGSKSNTIDQWSWNHTSGWQQIFLYGDSAGAGTSPSAVESNGVLNVFFVDASKSNTIADWSWNSTSGWQQAFLYGDSVAAKSSPSAVVSNGETNVFFADADEDNTIDQWWWSSTSGWQQRFFYGDSVAAGTSPYGL